tara:strand:- start:378 stop:755 length:378 start_codon:yes stop_codon:yes gene_type:complete
MINFSSGLLGYAMPNNTTGGLGSIGEAIGGFAGKKIGEGIKRFKKFGKKNPIDTAIGFNRNINVMDMPSKGGIGLNRGNMLGNAQSGLRSANNGGIGVNAGRFNGGFKSRYQQPIENTQYLGPSF